jgi:phosphoribosylanthranilate isomerase
MTLVKICGLRSPEDALQAAAAGADMLGFVFAPAKRQVTPEVARQAIVAAKSLRPDNQPQCVGVFVNDSLERIAQISILAGLDIIQLSGDEDPEFAAAVGLPVIKAIRPHPDAMLSAEAAACRFVERLPGVIFVLDSAVPGRYGGTGIVGDWPTASRMAGRFPSILAGGLTPENVVEAILSVHPLAVDVSSGVETNGAKDADKLIAFVRAAKAGEAQDERTG